jgi:glycyl-tRNA synthetase beta chain
MPEFFLELLGEEIPARMQARAAEDLNDLLEEALDRLEYKTRETFSGPRRIAVCADVNAEVHERNWTERGPRRTAPEQALMGFLRKHSATKERLQAVGDFWTLSMSTPSVSAAALIGEKMPDLLRRFPWPKSMRWGGTSQFTWIRPLRRIVCLLDGEVVRFDLRDEDDDGHGLAASNLTEGHRFLSPGTFAVSSCDQWKKTLSDRHVIVTASDRREQIASELDRLAGQHQLSLVDDPGLLDEVCGLVEWPVPLLGRIDPAYMDLPPEVMQVSMRVNQRYFALRDAQGRAAPYFAFVANITALDGGHTIVAGNERVLRARFADARHFWDLDRTCTLESRVAALDGVTFHAKLGTQGERVRRLVRLAAIIAPHVGANVAQAKRAALLMKADLTSGMVSEFPELQGVMGRYYALHDREDRRVADAIRDHYAPRGPTDAVPADPVGMAVALADKFDLIAGFFAIGEKPTGSGDPYALRRAALGIIRIVRDRNLRLSLNDCFFEAIRGHVQFTMKSNQSQFQGLVWGAERPPAVPEIAREDQEFLEYLLQTPARVLFVPDEVEKEIRSGVAQTLRSESPTPRSELEHRLFMVSQLFPFLLPDFDEKRMSFWCLPYAEAIASARSLAAELASEGLSPENLYLSEEVASVCRALEWFNEIACEPPRTELLNFVTERLRVQLRQEGARYDVLDAVVGAGTDDDIVRLLRRTNAVAAMLQTKEGADLLVAYRRAANILRAEEKKDGPHEGPVDQQLFREDAEIALLGAVNEADFQIGVIIHDENYAEFMERLSRLRPVLDTFFNEVSVNNPTPALRRNRLALLARVRSGMNRVADFSKIEG